MWRRAADVPAGGLSDAKLGAATGRSAAQWFEILDAEAATRLSHDQIVALVVDVYEAPEWGAQAVAVRYEQARGLPLPGLQPDGTFSVSASRSIRGDRVALLESGIARVTALVEAAPDETHRLADNTSAEWALPGGDVLTLTIGAQSSQNYAVTLIERRIRLPELVAALRTRLQKTVQQIAADAG